MKKLSVLLAIIFLCGTFLIVQAQNVPPPEQAFVEGNRRPNLLGQLGLTKHQINELRRINIELQPRVREAQRNWREANLALDEAIYADDSNDEIIKERVKAAQIAHSELIRSRAMMEYSIRQILTKEQLIKFRGLRQEFKQRQNNPANNMENPDKMIRNPQQQPLKRRILRPNQRPVT